jgi:hypothetical protein
MKVGIGVNAVTNELTITIQWANWEAIRDVGFCDTTWNVICFNLPIGRFTRLC